MAASPRPGTRRPQANGPSAPKTINLEEWEALTSLGDKEFRSLSIIQQACAYKALPIKLEEDASTSRPSTPPIRNRLGAFNTPSRPTTPVPSISKRPQPSHPLLPRQPVQNPQQFFDWFAQIERSVAHSQEAHFRAHLDEVSEHLGTCNSLIGELSNVQADVEGMLGEWTTVEEGGTAMKDLCEQLLDERDKLLDQADTVSARLEYFQELEKATRMLNRPGETLVLQPDFLHMVERVDVCIEFLQSHRHFLEAELYLLRFQQCLTRAMTLIKLYFVGTLKTLTSDISKRFVDKELSETAQTHLLYTRFQSTAVELAPLLGELERRTASYPENLSSLLAECHNAYFTSRKALLNNRILEEMKGLDPARSELVELTRSGCAYLRQLCLDEFVLYERYFTTGKDLLYQYLEGLCDFLYDDLRPRILHESRLTVLCQVCRVMQALMVLDAPAIDEIEEDEDEDDEDSYSSGDEDDEGDSDDEDESTAGSSMSNHPLGQLHMGRFLQAILQDCQTRLVFKAQSVIQGEIRNYPPKPEDLDYPNILSGARTSQKAKSVPPQESEQDPTLLVSYDTRDTWYPTFEKTVWVLSQLREFIQPAIFEDIAQEAIVTCRSSLITASNQLSARDPPSSKLDGSLFLIRHILLLKEVATKLNLSKQGLFSEADFAQVTETLKDMLRATTSLYFDRVAPIEKVNGAPPPGAPKGLDEDLNRACDEAITSTTANIIAPLIVFMEQVNKGAVTNMGETCIAADKSFRQKLDDDWPKAVQSFKLYVEEMDMLKVLFKNMQDSIVEYYRSFVEAAKANCPEVLPQLILLDDLSKRLSSSG